MNETIADIIRKAVPDSTVHVLGDDGQHFSALVISAQFEGVSLIKQHKMVMTPLKEEFAERLHALQLKTFTPEKWDAQKSQFGFE